MLFLPDSTTEAASRIWEDLEAEKIAPEAAYRKLLALNPLDYNALIEMGILRKESGDMAGAENYFWEAAGAQPCIWHAWMELAHVVGPRGDQDLSYALAELGLRRVIADIDARVEMMESPESFNTYAMPGVEIEDPEERIAMMVSVLEQRREKEPAEVTERLRRHRLLVEIEEFDALEPETVDAIVREGEAMLPVLMGLLRGYAQSDLLDGKINTVEYALALMGEIGSPAALPALLEFASLQDTVLSGTAGWAFDRIVELHPDEAGAALLARFPELEASQRMTLAERLAYWPRWSATDRLFDTLSQDLEMVEPEQRGAFCYALTMSMIVARRREGVQMARRMLRRHAALLDRATRRECEEQIEAFSGMGGNMLQTLAEPERPAWTVYRICAGEAEWPEGDEEEGAFDEDGVEEESEPVKRPVLPGRNDPCWCGSGKKYKKCHIDADRAGMTAV